MGRGGGDVGVPVSAYIPRGPALGAAFGSSPGSDLWLTADSAA